MVEVHRVEPPNPRNFLVGLGRYQKDLTNSRLGNFTGIFKILERFETLRFEFWLNTRKFELEIWQIEQSLGGMALHSSVDPRKLQQATSHLK